MATPSQQPNSWCDTACSCVSRPPLRAREALTIRHLKHPKAALVVVDRITAHIAIYFEAINLTASADHAAADVPKIRANRTTIVRKMPTDVRGRLENKRSDVTRADHQRGCSDRH